MAARVIQGGRILACDAGALESLHGRIRRDDWVSSAAMLHKLFYGIDA